MTNNEKYKQAFSALHADNNFTLEVEKMEKMSKHYKFKSMIASVAVCALLLLSVSAAYAADVGGIQRKVQLWIQGDQTMATLKFDGNGNYSLDYTDGDGNVNGQSGGGVAMEEDGSVRAQTEEELLRQLQQPDVVYKDDGSVWVYWLDQKLDITDKFEDEFCYVLLENDDETRYMTIKYQDGFSVNQNKYLIPSEF